jgi:lysophospholipase L1-like esterase
MLVLLGLLICVEIALRSWFQIEVQQITQRKVSQNLRGLKSEIIYQVDKDGLRSLQPVAEVKPENQIRILCLGASTTEQTTQETADTWCGILGEELKRSFPEYADRLQTVAFGVSGHHVLDTAFWLREHIDLIKPDVVITLLGMNDLAWNGGENYQYQGLEAGFSQRTHRFKRKCKIYSELCRRLIGIKQLIQAQLALENGKTVGWHSENMPKLQARFRTYPEATVISRTPDPFDEFRDASKWIASYLKKRNIKQVMLGQSALWQDKMPDDVVGKLWFSISTKNGPVRASGLWLQQEMARYNSTQQSIALENGAHYIDLDSLIPKTLDYYFDDCHFTDKGSRKVAMSVLPTLSSLIFKRYIIN